MTTIRRLLAILLFPVTTLAGTTVALTWNPSTTVGALYNVYRETSAGACGTTPVVGTCVKLNTAPVGLPTIAQPFVDSAPPANAQSHYVVRAVNSSGIESVNSNEVMVDLTQPGPPGPLSCTLTITGATVSGTCK
jgi:hypothetical protein